MIYLIGVIFAIICVCGWLIWYLKYNTCITLTMIIIGVIGIACSWISVAAVLFVVIVNSIFWLGEKGDSIIIWKKPKKK